MESEGDVVKRQIDTSQIIREGLKKLTLVVPAVTYQDGAGGTVFGVQVILCVCGQPTPDFTGTLVRHGYTFKGWAPEVSERVTGDAVYTAQWERIPVYTDARANGADVWEAAVSHGYESEKHGTWTGWAERR